MGDNPISLIKGRSQTGTEIWAAARPGRVGHVPWMPWDPQIPLVLHPDTLLPVPGWPGCDSLGCHWSKGTRGGCLMTSCIRRMLLVMAEGGTGPLVPSGRGWLAGLSLGGTGWVTAPLMPLCKANGLGTARAWWPAWGQSPARGRADTGCVSLLCLLHGCQRRVTGVPCLLQKSPGWDGFLGEGAAGNESPARGILLHGDVSRDPPAEVPLLSFGRTCRTCCPPCPPRTTISS